MILAHEFGNEHRSGSNNRCIHCAHLQCKEGEVEEDDILVVVDEEDMIKEEIEVEEIKQEEIEVEEIKQEEIEVEEIKQEEVEVEEIKQEEIREKMIFQYPFNEQHDSNKYILPVYVNVNELPLSPVSEATIKDEIYDWE
ncbi:unnamed protein product [Rotaria sordida]|uniref:Uncharacterized protein n=1 Tax=Rotaria sordida TaxID=392033 RepID=A0A815JH29_9BILA|nr:unnamed protein product [Rotaria sordida]